MYRGPGEINLGWRVPQGALRLTATAPGRLRSGHRTVHANCREDITKQGGDRIGSGAVLAREEEDRRGASLAKPDSSTDAPMSTALQLATYEI